jgi:hypothetical protein
MSFNLKKIKTLESFDVEIKDEEGNGTGVFFTLAGPNHTVRRTAQLALNRKMIAQANKTGKVELPDPEDSEVERLKNLANATLSWKGYVNDEGQEVPFSTATALALYQDPEMMWLVDQVDTALGAKDRFTKKVSTV